MMPASESAVAFTMTMTRISILLGRCAVGTALVPPYAYDERPFGISTMNNDGGVGTIRQPMQYLLLVYTDPALMAELPVERFNAEMQQCLQHADALVEEGTLVSFQQLEPPAKARSVRVRGGKTSILDGP